MATKTGIGSLKHKLTGLRRNSAKVLKKTNSLVSGAISQLKRPDKPKAKTAAAPVRRKPTEAAKPARASKATRTPAKPIKVAAAPASKKVRSVASPPVAVAAPVATPEAKSLPVTVTRTVRAAAAAATSPVKTVVAPLQQRVGSVLDFQLPSMPVLRRLSPMKPSPDSRASRATSKGKHAALSTAKAAAIQDAGALPADEGHDTV